MNQCTRCVDIAMHICRGVLRPSDLQMNCFSARYIRMKPVCGVCKGNSGHIY